jgi:hypothetical protein
MTQMDPDDVTMPTEAQLHKWAQANLEDSRFMHLPADMLRVLIHHVRDATLHANALLPREIAKERLFVINETHRNVRKHTCARGCGWVHYSYCSDDDLMEDRMVSCDVCQESVCYDCGIEICTRCYNAKCGNCTNFDDWGVCDEHNWNVCPQCKILEPSHTCDNHTI